ncbi:DMT family protein [Mucilaginibacter sp. UR6-1]|uniref:DMT family protein n=1 Tax=Mucilaginibacter sp. UR6-1 TaxID=1435643 RepID=UPI001E50E781|nr:DMT family protein [Mucilaginibacter sp. UR6-1]MCC8407324.1 DMT family protein [Mucilaginibacter sp. UR6-1]
MNLRALQTIIFLVISNTFMTFAWYGHLKFKDYSWGKNLGLVAIILISWGLAFFEYVFQVPANRLGYKDDGGPFSLVQLKVIQEAITLTIFMIFTTIFFKTEKLAWNHLAGFLLIVLAVYVIFKKW